MPELCNIVLVKKSVWSKILNKKAEYLYPQQVCIINIHLYMKTFSGMLFELYIII